MTRWSELGQRIAREQDHLLERSSVRAEVRARLHEADAFESVLGDLGRVPSFKKPVARWWIATTCALAAAATLVVWSNESEPAALAVLIGPEARRGSDGTWVEAPADRSVAMQFSDGTRVDVAESSRARITELRTTGAHLLLENGLARVHVQPRKAADWRVSAGPFAVKVTGTRFDVRWSPEQDAFELDLREGRVEISGCVFGDNYALQAGQRAVASCRLGRLHVSSQGDSAEHEPAQPVANQARELAASPQLAPSPQSNPPVTEAAPAAAEPKAARTPRAPSSRRRVQARRDAERRADEAGSRWQSRVEEGRYADALAAVRTLGFETECGRADADELLLLSDLARYGRDYAGARDALRLLRQRFSGTRQATRAAFALGKLESDHDGSQAEAAGWFRTYLRELPEGPLAREARGRLLEATARSGDEATARELAIQYLREYPSGPHAALAASLRDGR